MTICDIAKNYIHAGLSIMPIRPDASKAPAIPDWKHLMAVRMEDEEIRGSFRENSGIAAIGGKVSGNLEVLDFDDAETFTAWAALIDSDLGHDFFARLLIVKTPRPGFHIYTRCDVIGGNEKLAQKKLQDLPKRIIKALIETKAEGGYVLAPGCPGACHETGRTYQVVQGSFGTIPRISIAERDVLFATARSFNLYWPDAIHTPEMRKSQEQGTVGADFCQRASWSEILSPYGYKPAGQRGDAQMWTRPDKAKGVSASTNHAGSNLFYAFSTSCYPFDSGRGYNKFAVFTLLNHNGDFHAAAKALVDAGYGVPSADSPVKKELPPVEQLRSEVLKPSALIERVRLLYDNGIERGADPGWSTVREHWTLRRGEWTLVTGIPSHGKSSFVDGVMVNLARSADWKWDIWSAENLPQELHVVYLLQQFTGKPFHRGSAGRMSISEMKAGLSFIEKHFKFLTPPDNEETVTRLLALTELDSVDGLVIDPWNELTHEFKGSTETNYVSGQLKLIGRFVKRQNIHAIVVAHPAKLAKEKVKGGAMEYPVPTPYDISGSAHFRNKADNCLCLWRDESEPGTSTLFIQKVRRNFVGRVGQVELKYATSTGRFTDPNHKPDLAELVQQREPGAGPEEDL